MISSQTEGFGFVPRVQVETAQAKWTCRCTLLNDASNGRCIACGTPKVRQTQLTGGRASPSLGRTASGASSSSDNCRSTESDSSSLAVVVAAVMGRGEPARRRGRPPLQQAGEKFAAAAREKVKRNRVSPGRKSSSPANPSTGGDRLRTGSGTAQNGGGSSTVNTTEKGASALLKKPCVRRVSDNSNGSGTSPATARKGYSSSKSALLSAAGDAAVAAGLVRPSTMPLPTTSRIAAAAASALAQEEAQKEEHVNATRVQQQQSALQLLEEKHVLKRRAVAAAIARSAFAKVKNLKFGDVAVDGCPEERMAEAAALVCAKLGIESLVRAGSQAGEPTTAGRASTRSSGVLVPAGAAGATVVGVDDQISDGEELPMSSLFFLPPPKPPRYVKCGLYSTDPSGSAAGAAIDATLMPVEQRQQQQQQEALPPLPSWLKSVNGVIIPEGESVVVAPQPLRGGTGKGMPRSSSVSSGDADESRFTGSNAGISGSAANGDALLKPGVGQSSVGGTGMRGGAMGGGGADTDSQSADGTDDSASTGTVATADSLQWRMTAAERSRAYNAIFKNGGHVKKRSRSPVVSMPLRLPFPTAPAGVSLAADDLEHRPPCGHNVDDVQTEMGSEWAWGLLSEDAVQVSGEDAGAGAGNGSGKRATSVGSRYRDFRLPYELLYEQRRSEFLSEVGKLGMRSVEDAMEEFQTVSSNVHVSKKASFFCAACQTFKCIGNISIIRPTVAC